MTEATTMPGDLYECYLLFMEGIKQDILKIVDSKKQKDSFLQIHKPMLRKEFWFKLTKMKPRQRSKFEQCLRTPYKQRIKEGLREAQQAMDEYKTDPKVHERVNKECEEMLARARKSRKR